MSGESGRNPRYDILFEPVRIGPVTARNRFFQVPHCNGMGHRFPRALARMRGIKAEGGWAVVCTEECEIHPSSDLSPYVELRLWDEGDIPAAALIADEVHAHGALAGIQLTYNGHCASNLYSREIPLAPADLPLRGGVPAQARAMDKQDIRDLRRWHREAALRAKVAGFDLVYVYAGHDLSLPMHFLSRRYNSRTDEYGGSLENRCRLLRELIEDTKETVGDRCAVAVRLAVDELIGPRGITSEGEGREVIELLAELPDLWDVNVSGWENDSVTSRFASEGAQEQAVTFVKSLTSKPVVGVGRFTSPDTMVSQVRRGILDLIGAARPSIADPFLPKKIEEGRVEDIRECIGCNICVSGDLTSSPIRCTQNPSMGEEWRKGWHPESIEPLEAPAKVLIVGGGPAGLEAALQLGRRGCSVTLAEASDELGGRVRSESRLPGLAEWIRVRDYRTQQLAKLPNVETYLASRLTLQDVLDFAAEHVVLATGCKWRADGIGRANQLPIPGSDSAHVFTPDSIGRTAAWPSGPVVLFDDDHYYLGGVLAERLRREGRDVVLVTPAADVSHWTHNTLEQARIQRRLMELGVRIAASRNLSGISAQSVELRCVYTDRVQSLEAASVLLVTARLPERALFDELGMNSARLDAAGVRSVVRIGDCLAPGTIAAAVYSGHSYARGLGSPEGQALPFLRELPGVR